MVISRKLTASSLGRNTHDTYLMKTGRRRDTFVSTSKICPCCPCYKERYDGLQYFTDEEQRYTNDFVQERDAVWQYKTLKIAFVSFTKSSLVFR